MVGDSICFKRIKKSWLDIELNANIENLLMKIKISYDIGQISEISCLVLFIFTIKKNIENPILIINNLPHLLLRSYSYWIFSIYFEHVPYTCLFFFSNLEHVLSFHFQKKNVFFFIFIMYFNNRRRGR